MHSDAVDFSSVINIVRGDCFVELEKVGDMSIDAVITDPPFGITDCTWDKPLDLARWWELIDRKLSPTGVVVVFAAGRFTFDLYQSRKRFFRYDLVWEKSKSVGFLNSASQPLRSHELILVFARHLKSTTYNPQRTSSGKPASGRHFVQGKRSSIYSAHSRPFMALDDGTRLPRSVLHFEGVTKSDRIHPTQKPLNLMRWLVRSYSNPGDLISDPFSGGGSVAHACLVEGRRFFGCESNYGYYRASIKRLRAASSL